MNPANTVFFLPNVERKLPTNGDNKRHPTSEDAKIQPTMKSVKCVHFSFFSMNSGRIASAEKSSVLIEKRLMRHPTNIFLLLALSFGEDSMSL